MTRSNKAWRGMGATKTAVRIAGAERALRAVALLAAAALAMGCGRGSIPDSTPAGTVPSRVVCGSPAIAEIVFALGCGDRVAGVSDYTTHPPEAVAKPRVGGLMNPNRERLLMLEPDLLLVQGRHEALAAFAARYRIGFHAVKLDALTDVDAAIVELATALRVPERGLALRDRLRADLDIVRRAVAGRPPRRVLLTIGRAPGSLTGLATVGPGSFLHEMIAAAGGSNVFSDATGLYPQISKESLLVRDPEVIIELAGEGLAADAAEPLRADWREFERIAAVRNGHIHALTGAHLLIPGPRLGRTVEDLARAIHPEAFGE